MLVTMKVFFLASFASDHTITYTCGKQLAVLVPVDLQAAFCLSGLSAVANGWCFRWSRLARAARTQGLTSKCSLLDCMGAQMGSEVKCVENQMGDLWTSLPLASSLPCFWAVAWNEGLSPGGFWIRVGWLDWVGVLGERPQEKDALGKTSKWPVWAWVGAWAYTSWGFSVFILGFACPHTENSWSRL